MKAKEIAALIEEFAPSSTQEAWDNSGFCIGNGEEEVHGVMVGFDCTAALVREAAQRGADMIVTHHPLIFGGLKCIDPCDPVGEAVFEAVRRGVVVYSAHTNADKADGGVNALMAARLRLEECRPLDESRLCLVGNLGTPVTGERFISLVKERFSLEVVRCSAPISEVFMVATSCGAGSSFAEAAFRSGADAFVTGDVSYHRFFVPQGKMILDIGHYESEVDIVEKFVSVLRKKLPTFAVCTPTHKNNNPIYYY